MKEGNIGKYQQKKCCGQLQDSVGEMSKTLLFVPHGFLICLAQCDDESPSDLCAGFWVYLQEEEAAH